MAVERSDLESDQGTKEGQNNSLTIDIDGEAKTLTSDDVKNLIAQQASATQKTQEVAKILDAVNRYGVDVDGYLQNAEGSFAVMSKLMDEGVIDQQGNILKGQESQTGKKTDTELGELLKAKKDEGPKEADLSKLEATIMKGLGGTMENLTKQIERLQGDNVLMMRLRLQDQVQSKFDNIEEEDMTKIFGTAEQDKTKTFMQHAEDYSKAKAEHYDKLKAEWAKEHGVDLEKAEADKLFEQDPGGGAAAMFAEKKFSFKKGDKNAVTPKQAATEYFKKFDGFKMK